MLDFANNGDLMAYAHVLALAHLPERDGGVFGSLDSNEREATQRGIDRERQELREALAAIAEGRVTPGMRKSWQRRADGLVLVPAHGDDGTCRYRWLGFEEFKPPAPQFARGLWLLANTATTRLCQCKYRECRRFFRQPSKKGQKGGAQVRLYCPGTNHGDLEHNASASERMRKIRSPKRARAKTPKARRRA